MLQCNCCKICSMLVSGTVAQFMIVEHTRNRCSPIVNYGCSSFSVVKGMNADPTWERIGATIHLVDSLTSGLLAKSRNIDLHIYRYIGYCSQLFSDAGTCRMALFKGSILIRIWFRQKKSASNGTSFTKMRTGTRGSST